MAIKYLKKSPKQPSTDDVKTREIVQKLLTERIVCHKNKNAYIKKRN